MDPEKRTSPRIERGFLTFFPLVLDTGRQALFSVENVSDTGMLIRILDAEPGDLPGPGTEVEFRQCPEDMRRAFREIREIIVAELPESLRLALARRSGTVVWRRDLLCGLRFSPPLGLSPGDLRRVLEDILPDGPRLAFDLPGPQDAGKTPGG